jgi:hypothetical protein
MPVSIVGKVLRCLVLGKLTMLEPRAPVVRYPRERPGKLIHIDVKKLGRIEAIGHCITGDPRDRRRGTGWEYVQVCIDRRPPSRSVLAAVRHCGHARSRRDPCLMMSTTSFATIPSGSRDPLGGALWTCSRGGTKRRLDRPHLYDLGDVVSKHVFDARLQCCSRAWAP